MIGFIKRLFAGINKKRNSNNCEGGDFIYLKVKSEKYFGLAGLDFYYLKVRRIDLLSADKELTTVQSFFSTTGRSCNHEVDWYGLLDSDLSVSLIDESDFEKAKIKYIGEL